MKKREFQRCTNCVMDTTDSAITFDEKGVCDFCNDYYKNILPKWHVDEKSKAELLEIAKKIRKAGRKGKYDCIIGMSGGVDSSYLCYIAKEVMGLRPLLYSSDTGWNLKIADDNIRKIAQGLNLDLVTEQVDWEEMKDLQLAFFKSQVPYQDLPQDHAIFAGLYNYAVKHKIRYVLTGANNATECIRPPVEWVYQNDLKFILDVHKRFGKRKLKNFPKCSMLRYRLIYPYFYGMKRVAPLNYVEYDKEKAKAFLQERFGWETYDNKHYENIFTRFYEGYYLPRKFGYDKRKCYLSNLILTGAVTRDEALRELEKQPYDEATMQADKAYIAEKLGIGTEEFDAIMSGENKTFRDYRNSYNFIRFCTKILRAAGKEKKMFR